MLVGYRDDYAASLDQAQHGGHYAQWLTAISSPSWSKLDSAVNGQQEVMRHTQYKWRAGKDEVAGKRAQAHVVFAP
jgi:hypothetical protein